jgi:hypothetical protein
MGEGFRVRALYGTETVKAFIPAPISECTPLCVRGLLIGDLAIYLL